MTYYICLKHTWVFPNFKIEREIVKCQNEMKMRLYAAYLAHFSLLVIFENFKKFTAWNYIIFKHNILLLFTVCWNWKPKILIYVKSSQSVTKLTQYICTPLKLGFNWRDASFSTSETNLDGAPNVVTNVTEFAKVVQKAQKQTLFVFFNLKNNHIC